MRRKRRHYHTGTHTSKKSNRPIKYRSGWEQAVCQYLDNSKNVVEYLYEQVIIPYISNIRTRKIRKYYPDFLITYRGGRKVLVEVKRKDKLTDPKVMKKLAAACEWSKKNSIDFEVWTDEKIEAIKLANEKK